MQPSSLNLPGPRRRPQQQRSRTLVAAIRAACLQILASGGREQLTAKRIAEVAGVTIGSFYQYFPNKEAVMVEVLLEYMPEEAARVAADTRYLHELSEQSLPHTLREIVHLTCDRHLRLLAMHGAIYRRYHREIDFNGLLKASLRQYIDMASWEDWGRNLLLRHRAAITVTAIDVAAFLVSNAVDNLTADAVDNAPELLESSEFRDNLTQMLLRYLGVEVAQ
jgi:AcrR family transcriptional regulator